MNLPNFFSGPKKFTLASLFVMALLLMSSPFAAAAYSSSATGTPSSSSVTLPSAAPTYVGSAGHFLSGPYYVPSVFAHSYTSTANSPIPSAGGDSSSQPQNPSAVPPTVNCENSNSGCERISNGGGGAVTNPMALNAVSSFKQYGYDIEPPDQTVCANNQYTMEVLNIGEAQVYNSASLNPVSKVVSLDSLMGLPSMPPLGWGSGGDISCMYDYSYGGHWFVTEFVSTTPEPESPFTGCFAAVFDTCREGIAVSVTNNPMGAYNVYFLDPNAVNHDPGAGFFLNDYAKIASTSDAFLLFYDEFNLNPATQPACPAFGCAGFNGAQQFAFSKLAMESGLPAALVNVAYENMGTSSNLYPIPANGAYQRVSTSCSQGYVPPAVPCWIQVIPAQSPDPTQYDYNHGGMGFMVGALDFFGAGDNRIAVFDWSGLSALNTVGVQFGRNHIEFGGQIFTTGVTYMDEGLSCFASLAPFCGLATQKAGSIPLGNSCVAYHLNASDVTSCPEGGIATNGDGATQATYADGQVWAAVETQIVQTFKDSSPQLHLGATYWAINTGAKSLSVAADGYVTAMHEDLEFPTIAATDSGAALMSFTISGVNYYPSSAYTWLTGNSHVIHITALGQSPQDGFTEYQFYPTSSIRPRWGDYGAAVYVPAWVGAGVGHIVFASEYIQSPNCANLAPNGISCGGTRTTFANWGSSINYVLSAPMSYSPVR